MASPVEAANGATFANSATESGSAREIPVDRTVYAAEQAEGGAVASDEAEEAVIEGVTNFMVVEIFGMVTKGASESKRLQDEVHSQLKEAENENGG